MFCRPCRFSRPLARALAKLAPDEPLVPLAGVTDETPETGLIGPISAVAGPTAITPTSGTTGAGKAGGIDFASALDNVQQLQNKSNDLAVKAADGSLTDVHDYMIASTEASLATQLTVAVTNKAVSAFNDIMRMQA